MIRVISNLRHLVNYVALKVQLASSWKSVKHVYFNPRDPNARSTFKVMVSSWCARVKVMKTQPL